MTDKTKKLWMAWLSTLFAMLADGLIIAAILSLAYWLRFYSPIITRLFPPYLGIPEWDHYTRAITVMSPLWVGTYLFMGFYRDVAQSIYDQAVQCAKGVLLATLLAGSLNFLVRDFEYSRLVLFIGAILIFICSILFHISFTLFYRRWMRLSGRSARVLIIGRGDILKTIRDRMRFSRTRTKAFFLPTPELRELSEKIWERRVTEVLIIHSCFDSKTVLELSRVCEKMKVECKILPDFLQLRRGEIVVDGSLGLPIFHLKPLSLHGSSYYSKRLFDIVVSTLIISLGFFPLVLLCLLIKLDSKGKIFHTQTRIGLQRMTFQFFKFRTMINDAERMVDQLKHLNERKGPVFKIKNDPRVTFIGAFLRRYSLDEMPQLINVLRGEMSLVGPRPPVLWEAAQYDEVARRRLRLIPGMTGLWQVSGRATLSFEEMIDLDLYYLENWSLGLDLRILLKTLPAVIAGEGAY